MNSDICPLKETFLLGLITSFLIFGGVTLFEGVIHEWIKRIQKIIK